MASQDGAPFERHESSWSANLETAAYESDRSLVVTDALEAVERTAPGYHVNLVTHGAHGHPETYLYPALERHLGDENRDVDWEYVDRCGCGGHVTRVQVHG